MHHDGVAQCFHIDRGALDLGVLVAGQGLLDGSRVEHGNRCPAVRAGMIVANIHRRTATIAADSADASRQGADFGRHQLANETLFDHKLAEGRKPAVFLQAAMVVELAAMLDVVDAMQQAFVAARAMQWVAQGQALVVAVFMQQFEELDDTARRDLYTLEIIEPDALAGKAQVEHDFAMMQPLETVLAHGLLAGGAGDRFHRGLVGCSAWQGEL